MTNLIEEDPAKKRREEENRLEQSDNQVEPEQPQSKAQTSGQEQESTQQAGKAAAELPSVEMQALTNPTVELGQPPRWRRSLFAHWLEDRLDWLEDWLLRHKGFTEEEAQVVIRQIQAHHQEMEDEQWQLQEFFLVEIYRNGEGDTQRWKTVAFNGDKNSPHSWEGVPRAQLVEWMLNKLEQQQYQQQKQQHQAISTKPKCTILRAQIRQSSQPEIIETQESNSKFSAPIKGNESFNVDIQFSIDGLLTAKLPLKYEILLDAKEQTTNKKIPLSDQTRFLHQLVEQRDVYIATVEGLCLQRGMYQLRLVITDHSGLLASISPQLEIF